MSEDLYRCICHTCGTERLVDGLENAQAFFNEHAERAHEVELLNQQPRRRYPESDLDVPAETGDAGTDTDGAAGTGDTDDTNDDDAGDGA